MKNPSLRLLIILLFISLVGTAQQLSRLVNPLIGSKGNGLSCGYCFIGATYPFGMIQFSPGFFTPQRGFAVTQLSGAGCANMGNFPVLPMAGKLKDSPNDMNGFLPFQKINEAYAGYLSVSMADQTLVQLTSNKRLGIAKFSFTDSIGTVLIGSGVNATQVENARIEITSPTTCEGFSYGGEFCGAETPYKIYFAAEFDRAAKKWGTWMKTDLLDSARLAYGKNSGAYFSFDTKKELSVQYRIAISFVSVENAKENLRSSTTLANFEDYQQLATSQWDDALAKIKVTSENKDQLIQFYTHLYHSLIHPNVVSDVNGEYMGSDYNVHNVQPGRDSYSSFSVWDTYRTQGQLLALLFPKESGDMMQSLVQFAEQAGGYGRWILANIETGIMQGDPTPILIANSYAFGATDFDLKKAFYFMKQGATIPRLHSQNREIRPYLNDYSKKGFAPASMLLEYTSSDYAIGKYAQQALNNETEANFFISRASNWKNLFNPTLNWLCSRKTNGEWKNINADWREATYKNYFWMVPYDLKTLIDTIGGKKVAENRLDAFFSRIDASYDDDWFAAGNEPDFQVPWIYNWTDSPFKTNNINRRIFNELYKNTESGLPGNDDLGAMGAWYVFASVGLYPMVPGVGGFSVSIPRFSNIKITLPQGSLTLECNEPQHNNIQHMELNGKKHNPLWISLDEIKNGGTLQFKTNTMK
jgi:predicted alpha-1,2-mannosidase